MGDFLDELFDQFDQEEQARIRAAEASTNKILAQGTAAVKNRRLASGSPDDSDWVLEPERDARADAAGVVFVAYANALWRQTDAALDECIRDFLTKVGELMEPFITRYGWDGAGVTCALHRECQVSVWGVYSRLSTDTASTTPSTVDSAVGSARLEAVAGESSGVGVPVANFKPPEILAFSGSWRRHLRWTADQEARCARLNGRNVAEAERQEALLKDAREWAQAELENVAPTAHDVFQLRRRVVQQAWDEFIPRHRHSADFQLSYERFSAALWEEGWPSLEDRAIVASAAAARRAESRDTGESMSLTPEQGALLCLIVDEYRSSDGAYFVFTHSSTTRGLSYPRGRSIRVTADELDFQVLEKAGLLAAVWLSKTSLRGKPTQAGINAADARRRETAASRGPAGLAAIPVQELAQGAGSADFWESLRLGFVQLRAECPIDPPIAPAGRLTAIWTSVRESGNWRLHYHNGNDGSGVRKRFSWHAQSAAARLGFAGSDDAALSFWLDKIKSEAPESHLIKTTNSAGPEGVDEVYSVEILDICGLSADYCRKCQADEIRSRAAFLPSARAPILGEPTRVEEHTRSSSTMSASEDASAQLLRAGKRRGRRADPERRGAIRNAISKHGDKWREHLDEVFEELDRLGVALGDFQVLRIDLGDERICGVAKWADLGLAQGEQRKQIVDALRKYTD